MRNNSWALLLFLISIFCLLYYIFLPSSTEDDWIWGISLTRFTFISIFFIVSLLTFLLVCKFSKNESEDSNIIAYLNAWITVEKNNRRIASLSLLFFLSGIFLLSYGFSVQEIVLKSIFIRLFPFILWLTFYFGFCFLYCESNKSQPSYIYWLAETIQKNNKIFISLILFLGLGIICIYSVYQIPDRQYPQNLVHFVNDIKHLSLLGFWFLVLFSIDAVYIKFYPWILRIISSYYVKILYVLFFIGWVLIIINIVGLITKSIQSAHIEDLTKGKNESNQEYLYRLTEQVNSLMKKVSPNEKGEIVLRVPITENYVLSLISFLAGNHKNNFELCNYRAALSRGTGLCSQKAIVVAGLLQESGIKYRIIGLDGHVVVMAQVEPSASTPWWILDPDYGVVIEHTIDEVETNLDIITIPYERKGYSTTAIKSLKSLYDKQGNFQVNSIEKFIGAENCKIEKYSYILAWIIPILLILPATIKKIYQLL